MLLYLQKRSVKSLCLVTETVDEETKKYLCRSYKIVGEPQKIEIDEEGIVRQIGNFQNLHIQLGQSMMSGPRCGRQGCQGCQGFTALW